MDTPRPGLTQIRDQSIQQLGTLAQEGQGGKYAHLKNLNGQDRESGTAQLQQIASDPLSLLPKLRNNREKEDGLGILGAMTGTHLYHAHIQETEGNRILNIIHIISHLETPLSKRISNESIHRSDVHAYTDILVLLKNRPLSPEEKRILYHLLRKSIRFNFHNSFNTKSIENICEYEGKKPQIALNLLVSEINSFTLIIVLIARTIGYQSIELFAIKQAYRRIKELESDSQLTAQPSFEGIANAFGYNFVTSDESYNLSQIEYFLETMKMSHDPLIHSLAEPLTGICGKAFWNPKVLWSFYRQTLPGLTAIASDFYHQKIVAVAKI
jgi:hypothetical protein